MAADVLILIDQQKAMEHPKWGPRNNPDAERNIARLLAAWRERGWPIIHVRHDSTNPDSPFRPGQEGNDFLPLTAPRPGETVVANSMEAMVQVGANLGFKITIPADACWSCDKRDLLGRLWPAEDVHQLTLALLSGEYAVVATVEAILAGKNT
jgi:Isochorismatase family